MSAERERDDEKQLREYLECWRLPGGRLTPDQARALLDWDGTPEEERDGLHASLAVTEQQAPARSLAPNQRRGHVRLARADQGYVPLVKGPTEERCEMYARVATFEGDPAKVDDAIAMVRSTVEGEVPPGLEGAKMLMLVDRQTGKGLGITLFESEDAMKRGDAALNAMNPGGTERRVSVEFFEVPVRTVS